MATKFNDRSGEDRADEAMRIANRLDQECKRLGESSRKLIREYRERVRSTPR